MITITINDDYIVHRIKVESLKEFAISIRIFLPMIDIWGSYKKIEEMYEEIDLYWFVGLHTKTPYSKFMLDKIKNYILKNYENSRTEL